MVEGAWGAPLFQTDTGLRAGWCIAERDCGALSSPATQKKDITFWSASACEDSSSAVDDSSSAAEALRWVI